MLEHPAGSREGTSALVRQAGWVGLGGGAAVITYWTLFFTGTIEGAAPGSLAHEFELAFPLADVLLATAALGGGTALLRGAPVGVFLLAVAGAISLYLGVLDVSFYGRQGLYAPLFGSGGFELIVNAMCVLGGLFMLRATWVLWNVRPYPQHERKGG